MKERPAAGRSARDVTAAAVCLLVAALALAGHVWVGWQDQGKLVLEPVGPLSFVALAGWSALLLVAGATTLLAPNVRRISGACLILALLGLTSLFV